MKLLWKLMIAVLVIGVLLPFTFLKGKDGKPLMNFGNLKVPGFSTPDHTKRSEPKNSDRANNSSPNSIYEWKDEEGNIQFSNTPPAEGIEYTVREYDPNINVIQSIELPVDKAEAPNTEPQTGQKILSSDDAGDVYSPEQIKKLIDDAKNVENILNDRLKKQQATIDQ